LPLAAGAAYAVFASALAVALTAAIRLVAVWRDWRAPRPGVVT
jgi:hypothetical protein